MPTTKNTLVGRAPLTIAGDKLVFTSRSGKDLLVHENSDDVQFKQVTELKVRNVFYKAMYYMDIAKFTYIKIWVFLGCTRPDH